MIRIEFDVPEISPCSCCGKPTVRLTRFVYRDAEPFAIYYAQYTPDHERKILCALVGLGEWGVEGHPEDRVAFPLQIWTDEANFNVGLIDAKDSPWNHVTFLGRILNRSEALSHDRIGDVFLITDHMVRDDEEVCEFFRESGG
jgi:hypothetical protein